MKRSLIFELIKLMGEESIILRFPANMDGFQNI